jgi:D-proline reductase (dithiol) PrdB
MLNSIKENIQQRLGLASRQTVVRQTQLIENVNDWSGKYSRWRFNQDLKNYDFVKNVHAPFTPARRALPLTRLALISSAGAYINGTETFDAASNHGDASFREIPISVEPEDYLFAGRSYDTAAVKQDINVQIPIQRLLEYQSNGVIGELNPVWWSFSGFIPNARLVSDSLAPQIVERVARYGAQAALLVPASRLCHQSCAILARALEQSGIPTMMIGVQRDVVDVVRPPRCAFYSGKLGSIIGRPDSKYYQLRVLDEAIRWIESMEQPTIKKLSVDLETEVEEFRGEE